MSQDEEDRLQQLRRAAVRQSRSRRWRKQSWLTLLIVLVLSGLFWLGMLVITGFFAR